MKNIHPDYHEITVKLTNGKTFKTRSTYGQQGSVISLDIDPFSHPVWTGEGQKLVDTGGQISKFTRRFKGFANNIK
ncbi:MAG: 50S ribosomal protein L31 [Alphaproteobacteria bacterium]|nr:50S ribosomal protein L31 [Alphaproteobacteria bacterium]